MFFTFGLIDTTLMHWMAWYGGASHSLSSRVGVSLIPSFKGIPRLDDIFQTGTIIDFDSEKVDGLSVASSLENIGETPSTLFIYSKALIEECANMNCRDDVIDAR
jgi:hypothetical protein